MTLPYAHPYRFIPPAPDGTAPALWTPSLTPTVAWFDADDSSTITHAGGVVSDWANKNGNTAYDLEQLTVGERPSLSTADADYNDRTVIDFANPTTPSNLVTDGVADTITFAASVGVFEYRDPWGAHSTRPTAYSGRSGGSDAYYAQFTDNDTDGVLDGFIAGTHFLHGETTGVGGTSARAAELQDGPTLHTRKTAFTGKDGICVGADRAIANRSLNGKVAELIFLPTDDLYTIQLVEGYLAWKWGTQHRLDPLHPYKFSPPLVGRAPKPWTPAALETTEAWFDADAEYTIDDVAGAVGEWRDRSGNGNHVTQSTANSKPSTGSGSIAGRNVLTFDSSAPGEYMNTAGALGMFDKGMIFYVFEPDGVRTTFSPIDSRSPDDVKEHYERYDSFSGNTFTCHFQSARLNNIAMGVQSTGVQMLGWLSDATRPQRYGRYNGDVKWNTTAAFTFEDNINRVGSAFSATYYGGKLAEVIVVSDFDVAIAEKIEGYLAWKWGLVANLPATHPYKSAPPLTWE